MAPRKRILHPAEPAKSSRRQAVPGKAPPPKAPTALEKLPAPQQEYARHIAEGLKPIEAAAAAYPHLRSRDAIAKAASRLRNSSRVRKAVLELQARQARDTMRKFDISIEGLAQIVAASAHADVGDYFRIEHREIPRRHKKTGEPVLDREGRPIVDRVPSLTVTPLHDLSEVQRRAIADVGMSFDKFGNPSLDVKLHNKVEAATKLMALILKAREIEAPPVLAGIVDGGTIVADQSGGALAAIEDKREALKRFEAMRGDLNARYAKGRR